MNQPSSDSEWLTDYARLKSRVRKLTEEKANLYLVLHMVEQLNTVAGVDSLLESLMLTLCGNLGGNNVEIYYLDEGAIHYANLYGERLIVKGIEDELVAEVFESHCFAEYSSDMQHTLLKGNIAAVACTWVMPLMVGKELIGVVKMSDLLGSPQMREYLATFFSHIALILNNQIKTRVAESANTAKSNFLATISHEIRTPLNAILGMAQLLAKHGHSPERRQEYAQAILDSGRMLMALLNDVLDLSKIEARKLELASEPVEPGRLVEEIQSLFSENARQKHLALDAVWKGPVRQFYMLDPVRVRQMLSNLVSNAVKFTERGRINIVVDEISGQAGQAQLEFSVTDSGIGIPADKQRLLFLPFSQIDASSTRHYAGSGLGLSIVRRLAELMHGSIGVESREGQGARFWFRLPAVKAVGWNPAVAGDAPELSRIITDGNDGEFENGANLIGLDKRMSFADSATEASIEEKKLIHNKQEILLLLDEIDELLSKNMFKAIEKYKYLQNRLQSHAAAQRFNAVAPLLGEMKFKQAQQMLRQIRSILGWNGA